MERVLADAAGKLTTEGCEDVASFTCLEPMFGSVVRAVVALAGVALFIMLLVGGFKMLISGGDAKKLDSAKGTITNAVIGLVVIVASYLILLTIKQITGVNVTQFHINTQ